MAAPTLVATGFQNIIGNPATPSLTWANGDVIVCMGGTEGGGAETWHVPTTAGSGVTLVQKQLHSSSNDPGAGCWACVTTAASSGTFTMTDPLSGFNASLAAYVCRGSAGIGNSNISTGTSRTVSLPLTAADSTVIWGEYDWAAAAVAANTPTATTHSTASPGPSASPNDAVVSGRYTYYVNELDDETASGTVSFGIAGTGTGPFTIIAIEVLGSGGAAPTVAPIRPRFPSRVPIFRAANY